MNRITINGVTIETTSGSSVSVFNGVVSINGVRQDGVPHLTGEVHLKIEGDIGSVSLDRGSVEVRGDVKGNVDAGNGVTVHGSVHKSVGAGNSVTIKGDVGGDVDAGNSVSCGNVNGRINAGGNVRYGH